MRTNRLSRSEAKQIACLKGTTSHFVIIYAVVAIVALLLLVAAPLVFGATTISTSISTEGNLTVTGNATISGNTTVSGNTTLGDAATDTITVTGKLAGGSLFFVKEVNAELSVQTSETAATAGASLTIQGATGSTTGAGGPINITSGTGGTTGGNGGAITIIGGAATHSAANGGNLTIRGGAKGSAGTDGTITIGDSNTSTITIGYASGTTTLTGFTQHSAGTVSLPSISFVGDTDTGLFASAANTLQLVAGGFKPIQIGTSSSTLSNVTINGTTTAGNILAGDGVVGNPAYSFSSDPNTGVFSSAADTFQLVAGGYNAIQIGTSSSTLSNVTLNGTTSAGNILVNDGVVGNPAYSFYSDPNTGIFRNEADTMRLVAGGYAPFQIGTSSSTLSNVTIYGTTSMAGNILTGSGTVGNPAYSFGGDSDNGMFRSNTDTIQLVAGGYAPIQIGTSSTLNNVTINGSTSLAGSTTVTTGIFTVPAGTVGAPSITFSGDTNTGIYSGAGDNISFAANGNTIMGAAYSAGIPTVMVAGNFAGGASISYGTTTLDIVGSTTNTGVCKQGAPNAAGDVIIVDCDAAPAADYAERYPVARDVDYGDIVVPGTRVVYTDSVQLPNADGSGFNTFPSHAIVEFVKSSVPYQEPIAGIISDNWGDFSSAGNNINKKDNPRPVALVGRVPVKVTNEGGPIAIGDFLTTSSTPGHAMKATKAGRVIGMALGSFSGAKGKVMVQVLNTWWNPIIGENQTSAATAQLQPTTNVSLEKIEKLVVQGNARFGGQIIVGEDTAGTVNVKAWQKTARVDFGTAYKKVPVITVTPLGNPGGYFWISDVGEKGFAVNISKAPSNDLGFNWIAFGSSE